MTEVTQKGRLWAIQYHEGGPLEPVVSGPDSGGQVVRFVGGPHDSQELVFPEDGSLPPVVYPAHTTADAEAFAERPNIQAPGYTLSRRGGAGSPATYRWSEREPDPS